MKLQCDNCKHGPCKIKSNINLEDLAMIAGLCILWSTTAKWRLVPELSPNPWKNPEKMTLQEAIYKMSPGDIFKPTDGGFSVLEMRKSGSLLNDRGDNLAMSADAMKTEGQIIPAGPKVLTFREWFSCFDETKNRTAKEDTKDGFNAGDKNGQLREWLNHKELREMAENMVKYYPNIEKMNIHRLLSALRKAERNTGIKND